MTAFNSIGKIIVILFIIGCNDKTGVKVAERKFIDVKDSIITSSPPPISLKVSAHLMYNDDSISSFDILNDKSIALWNTIIGGGDAIKSSTKVKLILSGYVEDLLVKIKNGKRPIIEKRLSNFVGEIFWTIENTGCEEVSLSVFGENKILYTGTIPFHCGE